MSNNKQNSAEKNKGYICPITKMQCDDECCVSAEDCHIKSWAEINSSNNKQMKTRIKEIEEKLKEIDEVFKEMQELCMKKMNMNSLEMSLLKIQLDIEKQDLLKGDKTNEQQ